MPPANFAILVFFLSAPPQLLKSWGVCLQVTLGDIAVLVFMPMVMRGPAWMGRVQRPCGSGVRRSAVRVPHGRNVVRSPVRQARRPGWSPIREPVVRRIQLGERASR